jgi:hypothetical protein
VNVNDLFLYEGHVDYWRTILTAKYSPWFEDSNGRNGLHCLAEASLVTTKMPLTAMLLKQLDSLKDMGDDDKIIDRGYLVKSLLNVVAGVIVVIRSTRITTITPATHLSWLSSCTTI